MNKTVKRLCLMFVATCVMLMSLTGCSESTPNVDDLATWTVSSPDQTINIDMTLDASNNLTYSVSKSDTVVVERSKLGFTIEEDDFNLVSLEKTAMKRVSGSYENVSGKHSKVEYDCNELTITLKGFEFYLDVVMRAYDDGYAFRYNIRSIDGSSGEFTAESEDSEFSLPEGSVTWAQVYTGNSGTNGTEHFSYEAPYVRRNAGGFNGQAIAMPLLYQVRGSDVYSLITESDLIGSGYHGSMLQEADGSYNSGKFRTVHALGGIAEPDNVISYPFTSPWRVGIVGNLATVVESELVEKVFDDIEYWRPDNYDTLSAEEQEIYTYDWVEPDATAWNWLMYTGEKGQNDWNLQKEYIDLAAEMGWKYTILDGGWDSGLTDARFKEIMDYATQKGIKVIIWCDALRSFANGDPDILRYRLDEWEKYGVAGIKMDFFDGLEASHNTHQQEDIENIEWYETVYQETAKRKMIVIPHGCNKPTGERRKYPHVLSREAVYGNENLAVDSSVTVNQMFTRAVIGPSDFTPVVIPRNNGMTMAHQMALAVLFESGIISMADYAQTYQSDQLKDFYESIPTLRDTTVFLSGEPDSYYCAAIKSGDEWFIACVNSIVSSTVTVDFSFLDDREYIGSLFTDDGSNTVTPTEKTVSSKTTETISVPSSGGFVYHLKLKP